jgi:tetraacyldisaccharide 4'-kinase
MIFVRYLLFPFAILYGCITSVRNFLFDKGILKSYSFNIPIIAVGNLSTGGTGKTPQIEYLIRLLSDQYKVATLSRGYKRKSKGFILAHSDVTAEVLGDEPFQLYKKFSNVQVAVDANRKNGIEQLLSQAVKPEVVLLDDAFQHRKVKAGFYILLTAYDDLFCDDWMLPTGNLRESRSGAKRADMIIITKCPKDISDLAQENIKKQILPFFGGNQEQVYFSFIEYDDYIYNQLDCKSVREIQSVEKLLLAGIAKPEPFFKYLQGEKDDVLVFPDHHHFTNSEINEIEQKGKQKIIVTTEKDFVRLQDAAELTNLYYLPIKSGFTTNDSKINFDNTIKHYVGTASTNR